MTSASEIEPQGQTTRYWKKRSEDDPRLSAKPFALLATILASVFIAGLIYIPKHIESTVGNTVIDTLNRLGLGSLEVNVDGQDIHISGTLPANRLNTEIVKLHAITRGVTCEVPLLGNIICPSNVHISIKEAPPKQAPVTDSENTSQASASATATRAEKTFFQFHDFIIHKDEDFITIEGTMPNPKVRDLMLRKGTKFGLAVIDEMEITNTSSSEYFAWAVERAWSVIQYLESGSAIWSQGKFSVAGQITSEQADSATSAYRSEFFEDQLAGMNLDVRPVYNDVETCNSAFADVLGNASIEFSPETAKILSSSDVLLDRIAVLAEQCTLSFTVENHTGETSAANDRLALSQRRAESVLKALVDRGISEARLRAEGVGGTKPLENNNTPQARMLNRRTSIVATQK